MCKYGNCFIIDFKYVKLSISILIFVFFVAPLFSQDIKIGHLSSEDGLPSNTINTIIQDSEDFMWFGTGYGLSCFDGYNFSNFKYAIDDTLTLGNNVIKCLYEDKDQNIWIGTEDGLNRFNRNKHVIERIVGFDGIHIRSILPIQNNTLLIGTDAHGLIRFNPSTGLQGQFIYSPKTSSISSNTVFSLAYDATRGILVGTQNGLDVFNPHTEAFEHIISHVSVEHLDFYNDSSIFIGISEPGYYYKWSHHQPDKIVLPHELSDSKVSSILDTKDREWMGFASNGVIYRYKNNADKVHLLYNKHNPNRISSNAFTCFYKDKWGNVWLGTFDGGVNFIDKEGSKFTCIRDNFLPNGLRNNRVRSIYQDSDGDIWVGTKVEGTLSKFDRNTFEFEHYLTDNTLDESDHYISCITEHRPGELWVGTFNGLYLFNKKDGSYTIKKNIPTDSNTISSNQICALLKDSDILYIGHQNLGLDAYNTSTNTIINYLPSKQFSSISNAKVRVLFKDSQQNIWVGTMNGLNKFDQNTGTFQRYLKNQNDSSSISGNDILCIYEDENKNFWVGTKYGLNLMNRNDGTFKAYSTENGLADNSINAIYAADDGGLWLVTHVGVSKFNPLTNEVRNYNSFDGISSKELAQYAHCITSDGEILFGSNNGLTLFDPNKITHNENLPNVILTDFKIANKEVKIGDSDSPLSKHISQSENIVLSYKQTFVSFEYVAINYSSTENNRYAYMMEGLEDDWNYVGTKREVSYTNLSPGKYTFRVKASNNDGVWNQEGTSLHIMVLPPPWLSIWAYIIYLVAIIFLLVIFRNVTISRAKAEKEHEHNQQNLKFFINVSHEFRTPLTLILNPVKKILYSENLDETKEQAQYIKLSTNKLLNLVNQLLDFQKTDLGHLPLRVVNADIVHFSSKIFTLFKPVGTSKQISMSFQCDEASLNIWFDPDKYDKILTNLLSNAIKYTRPGGSIGLSIQKVKVLNDQPKFFSLTKGKTVDYVEIKLEDTGRGFNSKQISHVFERFYSKDNNRTGVGIGLNYTKSLVELHGGSITVDSIEGEGSTFLVRLPLGKEHLKEEQLCNDTFVLPEDYFESHHLESLNYDILTADTIIDDRPEAEHKDVLQKGMKLPVLLLVEDNKQLRQQLKKKLSDQYRIIEASNGKDGWEKVRKFVPDIVVSDVMMPIMDGIQLCKEIKNNDEMCHIPIILLTARGNVEHRVEGYEMGADEYISKPFHMEVLETRIHNILNSRRLLLNKFMSTENAISSKAIATNNQEKLFLDKLTQIILKNISDLDFGLTEIQEELGISRSNFHYKINKLVGTSPSVFVRTIKLKYAAELLKKENYNIKEISYISGFKNPSYFNQVFKEVYNTTPQTYRNQYT